MDEVADWGGINKWKEGGSLVSFPPLLIVEFDFLGGGRCESIWEGEGNL